MTTIKLKNGSGAPAASDLVQGEPALDLTNKRLYSEDASGNVIEVGTNPTTLTVDTDTLVVDASNNRVGIGGSSPDRKLVVVSSQSIVGRLESSGSIAGQLAFSDANSSATTNVRVGAVGDNYTIFTNNAERMRIDSSGNVGIGVTSMSNKLTVNGNQVMLASGEIKFADAGNSLVSTIKNGGSSGTSQLQFLTGSTPAERMRITQAGNVGINTTSPSSTLDVNGSLSKNSGSFKIDHPLPSKADTHHLVHSFVEGPQADNLYRGTVNLVDGSATVNLDTAGRMSEGTFVLLNTNVQCFTANESGWTAVKGSVSGNVLTITAQDSCADTVSWMVIGERCDQHMIDTEWTDENGRVITEPLKGA